MKNMKIIVLGLNLMLVVGCAMQQDMVAVNNRMIHLEKVVSDFQQRNSSLEKENARLKSVLDDYSRTREEKDQNLRDQSAGLRATLDDIRENIMNLNGKIEETDHRLSRKIVELEESNKQVAERIAHASQASPPMNDSTSPQMNPTPQNVDRQANTGLTENELYSLGKQSFEQSDFETSRAAFVEILKRFPNSQEADNAQFWIGEIYYRQQKYEQAIVEYDQVIKKYSKGNKVRAALLKQGFSFLNLGDNKNARLILQELIYKYPNTNESRLAEQKLKRIQ